MLEGITQIGPKRVRPLPTIERLREVLSYEPSTGELRWRVTRPGRGCLAGALAGGFRPDGYLKLTVDGAPLLGQRVIWALVTGTWPDRIVDHIDTNPRNNRFENLRLADGGESAANKNAPSNNTSGIKGVRERNGRWLAQITIKGTAKFLGSFATAAEARDAYEHAAKRAFGEFGRAA
ncbi:HNH endonuclease [Faunimonas pinastri]|uniref:HNH endonuclease n=1 Tax=Faunimonas pinastri TaxID=1855383 RepID=UPI00115FF384|nr:HNH endonuclease [Faunimonas pinastri]